jgi:hypothetical protein
MPSILTFRRGTAAQNDAFTGSAGEITVDSTNGTIRVHDGVTAGGSQVATASTLGALASLDTVDTAQIDDGAITNAKLANSSMTINGTTIALGGSDTITAGKILQVVEARYTDSYSRSVSTESWFEIDSTFRATITPTSTSSKILVMAAIGGATSSGNAWAFQMRRNGTEVGVGDQVGSNRKRMTAFGGNYGTNNDHRGGTAQMSFVDSPATTSAVEYRMYGISEGGTFYMNRSRAYEDGGESYRGTNMSSIILMEIAG